ncbi:HAMP domain-containing histidine kinase [Candidatus Bathyarchaeota archaeon]|nr:HAMP domain-containing histidine kinase [Candidatus Bathyarchaeota archaeon]
MGEDARKDQCKDEALIEKQIIERMSHISSELAHDLRSPLQTIQNAIYLIQRNPSNEQLFVMVKQSLTQTTEILDSFRDYYKAHILMRLEVDPVKVVELAFSELPVPDNIKVIKEMGETQHINIDPSKMALAIRKLLINSIEAMPGGGELTVKVSEDPICVTITIEDTGEGISPDVAEVIFTPFLANNKKGNGLGLPTTKRVVECHGGEICFTSIAGEGTVFTVKLPRSSVNL